jgi:N-acetylmuramoyl-L-alanine amidase
MNKFKNLRTILLTSVLTIGIPIISSQNVFADTLTTKTYTVKSGDCLSVIAKNHGQSLTSLREANDKWNDLIFPGQALKVSAEASSTVKQAKPTAMKYTASELDLLARLITAESQGEPYNAQVAVGAVVVNRVNHDLFPNSISAIINQRTNGNYEFTPVLNGNIKRPANESAIKAAREALSGNDPTNNALFFYDGATPKALTQPQPISIVIGNLTFVHLIKS